MVRVLNAMTPISSKLVSLFKSFIKLFLKREFRILNNIVESSVPLINRDKEVFVDQWLLKGDLALNDCRSILASRHLDYSYALQLTGHDICEVLDERRMAYMYGGNNYAAPYYQFLWFTFGLIETEIDEVRKILKMTGFIDPLAIIYASELISKKCFTEALSYIKSVESEFELCNLGKHIPLSSFVYENFAWGVKYQRNYETHCWLKNNADAAIFSSTIENKSVCIVGNSPIEIGRGSGDKIDSHDVVIRFNNFNIGPPYNRDYGTKTTVWVVSGAGDVEDRLDKTNFDLIIWEEDVWHSFSRWKNPERLHDIVDLGIPLVFINAEMHVDLRRISGLIVPSTGLLMCFWVYKILGYLNKSMLFGFSLVDQVEDRNKKHYFSKSSWDVGLHHNWTKERQILDLMLKGEL